MHTLLMITIMTIITLIFSGSVTGLILVIKHFFISKSQHFFIDTCNIRNCLITTNIYYEKPYICYNAYINYDIYLMNFSYSKNTTFQVHDVYFCEKNTIIKCYYDDGNVLNSLRLFSENNEFTGILCIILFSILMLSSMIIAINFILYINNKPYYDPNEEFLQFLKYQF